MNLVIEDDTLNAIKQEMREMSVKEQVQGLPLSLRSQVVRPHFYQPFAISCGNSYLLTTCSQALAKFKHPQLYGGGDQEDEGNKERE